MSIRYEEEMSLLLKDAVLPNAKNEDILQQLARLINDLIVHDFERLIRILYRVDVDERKLKKMLHDHPQQDAGILIAELLIDRQLQKEHFKKTFSKDSNDIPEEDRWT